ncbi:Uncharacterised protein [Mycobacteroides abscessus subsp. abscessus]|nr:Uncharacterised protein [Mycobacteroides abscessus subsp. abscessus]
MSLRAATIFGPGSLPSSRLPPRLDAGSNSARCGRSGISGNSGKPPPFTSGPAEGSAPPCGVAMVAAEYATGPASAATSAATTTALGHLLIARPISASSARIRIAQRSQGWNSGERPNSSHAIAAVSISRAARQARTQDFSRSCQPSTEPAPTSAATAGVSAIE